MSLTFRDIHGVKDDDQFIMSGKNLKELLSITMGVRSGPDRIHFQWGGQLSRIVCDVQPIDLMKLLTEKGASNGNA